MMKDNVKFKLHNPLIQLAIVGASLVLSTQVLAQDAASDSSFKLSGYVSVVGGRVLSGNLDANYVAAPAPVMQIKGVNCPCYVADWNNAGVYGNDFSLAPESRVGIQGKYTISNKMSVTAQLVSRGTNGTPDVTWAYGSYKVNDNFEVQVGRKRVPLYYYSDFQDIGVSYPWITPPPELYGWEATNYNGASVRYSRSMGDANLSASLFGGQEKVNESLYQKLYYPAGTTAVQWNNLIGADIEVNRGPLTLRAVVMKADVRSINNDPATLLDDSSTLKAYGLAANLDLDKWFVLSEFTQLTREFAVNSAHSPYKVIAPAFTVGAGMRLGKWTPFINYAQYAEETNDVTGYYILSSYKRTSVTLRYDLDSSSAIKAQLDKNYDVANNFGGDTTVLRVSYDRVF